MGDSRARELHCVSGVCVCVWLIFEQKNKETGALPKEEFLLIRERAAVTCFACLVTTCSAGIPSDSLNRFLYAQSLRFGCQYYWGCLKAIVCF